jgi:DNA polymerase III alpha subunit
MHTDLLGIPVYSKSDILDIIYQGKLDILKTTLVDIEPTEFEKFNSAAKEAGITELRKYHPLNITTSELDQSLQENWLMPDFYREMDIAKWVLEQCNTQDQLQRVGAELLEFQRRDMMPLLKWMKYFVDTCRANGVVWGVGRGSSVASYVLYLIGVHRIDSMKYNLDWQEFLR